jgi:hypothetical protein
VDGVVPKKRFLSGWSNLAMANGMAMLLKLLC